jgi:hypothetical protein
MENNQKTFPKSLKTPPESQKTQSFSTNFFRDGLKPAGKFFQALPLFSTAFLNQGVAPPGSILA